MAATKPRLFAQDFGGESVTQQHFAESCDVNNIVNHFRVTGEDPFADRIKNQKFGFASSQTFEEALRNTADIQSAFQHLPAKERDSFDNDPALWLDSFESTPTPTIDSESIVQPEASEAADAAPEASNLDEMDST